MEPTQISIYLVILPTVLTILGYLAWVGNKSSKLDSKEKNLFIAEQKVFVKKKGIKLVFFVNLCFFVSIALLSVLIDTHTKNAKERETIKAIEALGTIAPAINNLRR